MQKIYYVKGYNSYSNKEASSVFTDKEMAKRFMAGLTDPKLFEYTGRTICDAVNNIFN